MRYNEINKPTPLQPDTQNTGMAQNQLLKIGQHAIKIENMIADNQEISEWASNKINLASDYVKKIHNTLSEFDNPREKPNVQPRTSMDPKELGERKIKSLLITVSILFSAKRYKVSKKNKIKNKTKILKFPSFIFFYISLRIRF